jgi:hypothetical protein
MDKYNILKQERQNIPIIFWYPVNDDVYEQYKNEDVENSVPSYDDLNYFLNIIFKYFADSMNVFHMIDKLVNILGNDHYIVKNCKDNVCNKYIYSKDNTDYQVFQSIMDEILTTDIYSLVFSIPGILNNQHIYDNNSDIKNLYDAAMSG